MDAQLLGKSRVEVLTNGRQFYEAELADMRAACHSIHLKAYVLRPGDVTERFLDALTERARAGATVRVVIDAIGSVPMRHRRFRNLRAAVDPVSRYYPIRYTLKRSNNRTHREIIVVDGRIGFAGGAGFADLWAGDADPGDEGRGRPWRDTMLRIEGELVGGLQTTSWRTGWRSPVSCWQARKSFHSAAPTCRFQTPAVSPVS